MTGRDNKRGSGWETSSRRSRLAPIARELTSEREPIGEGQRFPKSISGEAFVFGEPIKQSAKGRICSVDGCETKLSVYNPSENCAEHPYTKMVMQTPKSVRASSVKSRKKAPRKRR